MNKKHLFIVSTLSIATGVLLFAFHYEYISIHWPQPIPIMRQQAYQKKLVTLHYWKDNSWNHETNEIIWLDNTAENLQRLLNNWLHLLEEEEIITKRITIQSIAQMPNNNQFYLSFDRNPLLKEWSIYHKWMFIEGLLKTIRSNESSVQSVLFLMRHQPLADTHLDLSHIWPIQGLLST